MKAKKPTSTEPGRDEEVLAIGQFSDFWQHWKRCSWGWISANPVTGYWENEPNSPAYWTPIPECGE